MLFPASPERARSAGDTGLKCRWARGRGAEAGEPFYKLGRTFENQGQVSRGHVLRRPPLATPVTDRRRAAARLFAATGGRHSGREKAAGTEGAGSTAGVRSAARRGMPEGLHRTQDGRKPPQGRGFPFGRRTAAGYDGYRCVVEQAGGGSPASDAILRRPVPS